MQGVRSRWGDGNRLLYHLNYLAARLAVGEFESAVRRRRRGHSSAGGILVNLTEIDMTLGAVSKWPPEIFLV